MAKEVILEKDKILESVIEELSKKNYLETKFPSLNRGEIIGCTQKNITLQWVLDNYERIGIDSKELQRYLQDWTED